MFSLRRETFSEYSLFSSSQVSTVCAVSYGLSASAVSSSVNSPTRSGTLSGSAA